MDSIKAYVNVADTFHTRIIHSFYVMVNYGHAILKFFITFGWLYKTCNLQNAKI